MEMSGTDMGADAAAIDGAATARAASGELASQMALEDAYVMRTYGRKPVEFVEGRGMVLVDSEGREYLDFLAGIAVVCLGHSDPAVIGAIQAQAARLMQTSNYYYAEGRGELARMISDLIVHGRPVEGPRDADEPRFKTFFTNSGAEANEGAIKLARRHALAQGSEARGVLSLRKSFHGRTLATLAATGQPSKQESFEPLPGGFSHVDPNDIQALEAAISSKADGGICAVMVECVQGESGVWPLDPQYAKALREMTSKRGILFMVDEVQTGFFRCGDKPFAFQKLGVDPDVVTLAKGIASGFPMGAFSARADVADSLVPGEHGSTFGGNPLAVAAARATIAELIGRDLGGNSERVGAYMRRRLSEMEMVTDVRGMGLMVGLTLAEPLAGKVVDMGLERGLVLNSPAPDMLRFVPPLICTEDDVDEMMERLRLIVEELFAQPAQ